MRYFKFNLGKYYHQSSLSRFQMGTVCGCIREEMEKDWLASRSQESIGSSSGIQEENIYQQTESISMDEYESLGHSSLDRSQLSSKEVQVDRCICLLFSEPIDLVIASGVFLSSKIVLSTIQPLLPYLQSLESLRLNLIYCSREFLVTKIDVPFHRSHSAESFGPHDWVLIHVRPKEDDELIKNSVNLDYWEDGPFPEVSSKSLEDMGKMQNYFYSHSGNSRAYFEASSVTQFKHCLAIHSSSMQILAGSPLISSLDQTVFGMYLPSPSLAETGHCSPPPGTPTQSAASLLFSSDTLFQIQRCLSNNSVQTKEIASSFSSKSVGPISFFAESLLSIRPDQASMSNFNGSMSRLPERNSSESILERTQPLKTKLSFILYW